MIDKFNIRTYGILLKEGKILLSFEKIGDRNVIKLPGGGVEFGEGTVDAIKRELAEELNIETFEITHHYTTDFFIQSSFRSNEQVIAIYYLVTGHFPDQFVTHQQENSFGSLSTSSFKWTMLSNDLLDVLSFETDKTAVRILLDQ